MKYFIRRSLTNYVQVEDTLAPRHDFSYCCITMKRSLHIYSELVVFFAV